MLLQQDSTAAPNCQCRRHETRREERRWGRGRMGGCPGLDLRCRCARQVRRGGFEVTPTPTHATRQSVTTAGTKSCVDDGAVRCGAVQARHSLEQSLQNRELGLAKTRGWGTEGLRGGNLWGTSGLSCLSGPGHCAHYATLLPWTHACWILHECKFLFPPQSHANRTGRSSDLDIFIIAGSKR